MINLIIKSYFIIFMSVAVGMIFLFGIGLYFLLRKSKAKYPAHPQSHSEIKKTTITSRDISAIAGENAIATQLDLARAYIETGRKQLAKKILLYAIERGDSTQQIEAKDLINKAQI